MIPRLALAAGLLAALTNCQPNQITSAISPDFEAYQAQSDYRAFAYAFGYDSGNGPENKVSGWASGEKSVQAAIDAAMANCQAKGSPYKCRYYAIGNIEVSGLTGPQLDRAIAVYAENPSATNADFLANAAQAAEAK